MNFAEHKLLLAKYEGDLYHLQRIELVKTKPISSWKLTYQGIDCALPISDDVIKKLIQDRILILELSIRDAALALGIEA